MTRLALLIIGLFALPASADVRVFSADSPLGKPLLDVGVGDGKMALEAYAGDRHRQIGQSFTLPGDAEVAAFTMTVGEARDGARGAAVRVTLAEVEPGDVGGGDVLAEGVGRLPAEMPEGSLVGFEFDGPVRLEAGRRYAVRLKFVESAPGRAVSFRVGPPRGRTPASFILSTDEEPWRVAEGRSVEMRVYDELADDAVTFVPRRTEDLEPRPATIELAADLPAASLAQRQYRPDVFDVGGVWHAGGGEQRIAQTFTWPGGPSPDTVLLRVRDFSEPYHGNAAGAPLQVAVVETAGDAPTGEPLGVWRANLPGKLRHSAYLAVSLDPLPLKAGRTYAVHVTLPESAPRRHLSLSAGVGDPMPGGRLFKSQNGGPFVPVEDADLTFALASSGKASQ